MGLSLETVQPTGWLGDLHGDLPGSGTPYPNL